MRARLPGHRATHESVDRFHFGKVRALFQFIQTANKIGSGTTDESGAAALRARRIIPPTVSPIGIDDNPDWIDVKNPAASIGSRWPRVSFSVDIEARLASITQRWLCGKKELRL
jgi:hypothetical protein